MKKTFLIFVAVLIILFLPVVLYAGTATITTYYSSPNADYKDITVENGLTAANATIFGGNTFDVLDILDNQYEAKDSTNPDISGGNLSVSGNVNIDNLFYVDSVNKRVGINTTTPQATLEIKGILKGMILGAHQDPLDFIQKPWFDMYAQWNGNGPDTTDAVTQNAQYRAFFDATYSLGGGAYNLGTLYLDGNPLVFQSQLKSGLPYAGGYGQVAIRSYIDTTHPDAALIVGEPDPSVYQAAYPGMVPAAWANNWVPIACSRKYKKDIQSFTLMDYRHTLEALTQANTVSFHYKMETQKSKLHYGFIAEDAPVEIASKDRKAINLMNETGFLLASLKALKLEDAELKQRIERLREWKKINS